MFVGNTARESDESSEGAKMGVEKFEKIREMQMADEEKRKRATWVIDTEKTMEETERDRTNRGGD